MSIVVTGELHIGAEGIAALREALQRMQRASQAEAGCEVYAFSVDIADPGLLRITERWQNMAALAAHFAEPHMAEFREALSAHPPSHMEVGFYEAEPVEPPAR